MRRAPRAWGRGGQGALRVILQRGERRGLARGDARRHLAQVWLQRTACGTLFEVQHTARILPTLAPTRAIAAANQGLAEDAVGAATALAAELQPIAPLGPRERGEHEGNRTEYEDCSETLRRQQLRVILSP
jgi:hypothetical protein